MQQHSQMLFFFLSQNSGFQKNISFFVFYYQTTYFGQTWSASMIWQMHSFKDVKHQISESLEFCDVYSIYFDVCIYMCMYTCIKRRCACHVHISHYMVTIAIWQSMFVRIHLFFFCVVWLRLWLVVLVVLLTWSVRSSRRGSNTWSATTKSTTKQEQNADNMEAYLRFFLMVMLELFRNMFFFEGMGEGNPTNNSMNRLEKVVLSFFFGTNSTQLRKVQILWQLMIL